MKTLGVFVARNRAAAVFLAVTVVIFTVVGLVRESAFLWVYLPVLAGCIGGVVLLDHRRGPIPSVLIWLLVVWAGMHLAGGLAPNPTGDSEILYGMWLIDGVLRYDQLVHGFGIGAATAVFAYTARDSGRPLFWGFVLSQAVGLVNETVENVFAALVEGSNVGDIVNTTWDMIWHVIGATVATVWMARRGIPGHIAAADYGASPKEAS
ncbi:MAG TPA: hypothetical protein VFY15_04725 [Acidimicrobiia bacterium]|nr:hypothetical protein [Acidimicrobiia bacterium]